MQRPLSSEELLDLVTASAADPRPMPRTMIVVAHPDDETLALGGRLARHRESFFVYVTDGAPLDGRDCASHGFSSLNDYRRARQEELMHAFHLAGIPDARRLQLDLPDQRSAWHLEFLISKLLVALQEFSPHVILTHPYEGGHPDHDVCSVAVHRAVVLSETEVSPAILESTFYHAGPDGIETNCFLREMDITPKVTRVLSPEESRRKQELLACFVSQSETLRYFRTDIEQYRIAPAYNFGKPPHEGELFYEKFPWGITGAQFRELAGKTEPTEMPA